VRVELWGVEVMVHIGLVEGSAPGEVSPDELVLFCRQRLAPYKVPRYVEFRAEPFPRTPSMRVKKSELIAEDTDPIRGAWDRDREMPDWSKRT
jgi:acyl-CoA synthetase (AMP-forming)/AMP-acid ligase II